MSDKNTLIQPDKGQPAIPIHLVDKAGLDAFVKGLSAPQRAALAAQKFEGDGYSFAILPDGDSWFVVSGVANVESLSSWCMARLAEALPAGTYRRAGGEPGPALHGWLTGQYRFDRYLSKPSEEGARVLLTKDVAAIEPALAEAAAVALVRDLVNTPAEDMGPAQLEHEAHAFAKAHRAEFKVTSGDALERGFPMVHGVGRAAARSHAPRMIELHWGDEKHPRVAIVGKGVCFDSGGLDIKPSSGMLLMKKDMGGAAHALALAQLVMQAGLKVRLHLLIPAVENAISGNAFRPGDVLRSRAGISVEIGNTDAEGRLVLGDTLTRAGEEEPELVIDFATLTGAARVAVGPDLPALFTRRDETAEELLKAGEAADDRCWRLPLFDGYREYLKSDIADLNNSSSNGFAGASVAGLFLDRFVPEGTDWAHFDTFAWRPAAKPGRPKGGDALGLRAAWGLLKGRYG
ncbi:MULTISPECIES: leucyl aminopeptidase family protein [unclassified Novosphingobium]|uniref:leucyl aminopeptidase family protein n=1 Tax=unclassified Novosphingobium TaxID=2644732 RepID=UPI000ED831B8|nr:MULTISPECIES: leucyl aminopeptidase family protein [unclassified Novosphingobium]HCF24544.1 aminopeptidase [Novosphingobium sp.]HQV03384.1 leucyl aminopeptidase family protein [Novosphingobium sp.]